ncbi:MAG: SWIB/MDM2 domain-containing protein [Elusimicrobiales bacterium]
MPTKKKTNTKFMAPVTPDTVLAEVVGSKPLPRTQITKKIWDYIKKNGLQDKNNKRMINTDEKLAKLFNGKKQVSMFDIAKAVNKHISTN